MCFKQKPFPKIYMHALFAFHFNLNLVLSGISC